MILFELLLNKNEAEAIFIVRMVFVGTFHRPYEYT